MAITNAVIRPDFTNPADRFWHQKKLAVSAHRAAYDAHHELCAWMWSTAAAAGWRAVESPGIYTTAAIFHVAAEDQEPIVVAGDEEVIGYPAQSIPVRWRKDDTTLCFGNARRVLDWMKLGCPDSLREVMANVYAAPPAAPDGRATFYREDLTPFPIEVQKDVNRNAYRFIFRTRDGEMVEADITGPDLHETRDHTLLAWRKAHARRP
jgi:hypothetical protein